MGNSRFGKVTLDDGKTVKEVFYAAFNYQNEFVRRTAVCAYEVAALRSLFTRHRQYYVFDGNRRNALAIVTANESLDASQCDSLSADSVQFVRDHPLLTASLNPIGWKAIFVADSNVTSSTTSISVDWQVAAADGNVYNVLYLGTSPYLFAN